MSEAGLDDYLVLDLASGRYYEIGTVGGEVWKRLDGARSLDEVAEEIAVVYGVTRDRAATDVVELVADLRAVGLAVPAVEG